jgi:PP-loop superfamily ATP-utilizing enzyme
LKSVNVETDKISVPSTLRRFNPSTSLARIEVGVHEMGRFLESENFTRVAEALTKIGYAHVTLDLRGYRRGSLNEFPRSGMRIHASRESTGREP